MEYFAGLDVSLEATHICVLDRDGAILLEAKTASSPEMIAETLSKAPPCKRVVFETGRMAPMLYHDLEALGVAVICIESRQAYETLKTLATHKTDRNDARGLAHLARTGFFKATHVKSLPAHALRTPIAARKKLVGQRVTLENQIRGLAIALGVEKSSDTLALLKFDHRLKHDVLKLTHVAGPRRKSAGSPQQRTLSIGVQSRRCPWSGIYHSTSDRCDLSPT